MFTKNRSYFIKPDVRRGDIYYCDLNDGLGSEQKGVRPVLVLQNDVGNNYSDTTIVAPITTQKQEAKMPTHFYLSSIFYPLLKKDSKILLEQIRTVDMRRLLGKFSITHLVKDDIKKMNHMLSLSIGLDGRNYESDIYRRGEVYLADFGFAYGREYRGKTPVVIVQNNKGNEYSPTLIVVPINTKKKSPTLPTHVAIKKKQGLSSGGIAQCEQVRTIDKFRVFTKLCNLNFNEMVRMDTALRVSLFNTSSNERMDQKQIIKNKFYAI